MSEPTTRAGKALRAVIPPSVTILIHGDRATGLTQVTRDSAIAAIEAEARQQERERWETAVLEAGGDQALVKIGAIYDTILAEPSE